MLHLSCTRRLLALLTLGWAAVAAHAQPAYQLRLLPPFSPDDNIAHAINDHGDVVGRTGLRPASPTLWRDGTPYLLQTPPIPTYYGGTAHDINHHGTIVGQDSAGNAIIWRSGLTGSFLPGTAPGTQSAALALNDRGEVVGWSQRSNPDGSVARHATVWRDGARIDLPALGTYESQAQDLNEHGQIAGWSFLGDTLVRNATLWQDGQVTSLGTAGIESWANAINERGVVGGAALVPGSDYRAMLWHDGTATVLDALGSDSFYNEVMGLNDAGLAVGFSANRSGGARAILWQGTSAYDLNASLTPALIEAGWSLSTAQDINNLGWITGIASNRYTAESVVYLLAPVPEPGILALLGVGLAVLGWQARRRR